MMSVNDRPEALIYSDLSGSYVYEGQELAIQIYRLTEGEWVVEICANPLSSLILEDFYSSEESAYAAALQTIHEGALDAGTPK